LIAALAGFSTGLSLIIAIGAQNAFVLRQGLRRTHVLWVVLICAISDALLIALGVLGLGVAITSLPWLIELFRFGGAAYLLWFAFQAAARSLRPGVLEESSRSAESLRAVILTTLAITYLNPHVYIDTVLLLGSIANQFSNPWLFALGAAVGSLVWFFALGFGAQQLGKYVKNPRFWRYLDAFIALVMTSIAILLIGYQF